MDIGNNLRLAIASATLAALLAACGGGGGAPVQHALTAATAGTGTGSVTSAPAGINCGASCAASLNVGTAVTLTATASSGSVFAGWSGACSGAAVTASVTMNAALTCTANFTAMRALGVSLSGAGSGTVTGNPAGIACGTTCSASHVDGTSVVLTAAPAAGSAFVQWGGDCAGTATSATVVLTAPRGCTAQFEPVHTVTVTKAGNGAGSVTSNVGGINCGTTCSAELLVGTSVTLMAAPANGSAFVGWSGACSGGAVTASVTMNAPQTCTATFNAVTVPVTRTLTVTNNGTGSGTVTSAPAGINCGATCSTSFADGTAVTLTATPTAGSTFTGWGGACSGTAAAVAVTMGAASACSAMFNMDSPAALSWTGYHAVGYAGLINGTKDTITFAAGRTKTSNLGGLHVVNVNTGVAHQVVPDGTWVPPGGQFALANRSAYLRDNWNGYEAAFDPQSGFISDHRVRFTTFARNGRLYKIDHVSTTGTPAAQLWGNVPTTEICLDTLPIETASDIASTKKHWIYVAPGSNGSCDTANRVYKALAYSASETDAPITLPGKPLLALHDRARRVTGYIIAGKPDQKVDADFSNPLPLGRIGSTALTVHLPIGLVGSAEPRHFIAMDGLGGLHAYDLLALDMPPTTLLGLGVTAASAQMDIHAQTVAESGAIYIALYDTSQANTRILKVAADLSVLDLGRVPGQPAIGSSTLRLTQSRVIVKTSASLYSIPKGGGIPVQLASGALPSSQVFPEVVAVGNTVWYLSSIELTTSGATLVAVDADGTSRQTFRSAAWTGTFGHMVPLLPKTCERECRYAAIAVNEGPSVVGVTGNGGTLLRTYDAATRAVIADHGNYPPASAGTGDWSFAPTQLGQKALVGFRDLFLAPSYQLFMLTTDLPGLTALTVN